jgi:hypothetical protein
MPVDQVSQFSRLDAADRLFDPVTARAEHLTPGEPRVLSKKEEWAREKALRPDVHVSDADLARWSTPSRAARARRLASRAPQSDPMLWPGERIEPVTTLFNIWTHEALPILPGEGRIEVVSGYRSPKYNLMLRKKGHQVARHSQHMEGHAVDFRIRGVTTRQVLSYVRSLHMGGVGFYPHSQFVHSDTGPVRYWTGS